MSEQRDRNKIRESKKKQKRSARHAGLPVRDHGLWRIRWTDSDGKRRSKHFAADAYDEAIADLERVKGEVRAVKDGRAPAPTRSMTFGRFYKKYWLPNRGEAKRSAKSDANAYKAHVAPFFADLSLIQCTTAKIEEFRAGLKRRHPRKKNPDAPDDEAPDFSLSPATTRNVLALVSAVLHYAHAIGQLSALPHFSRPRARIKEFSYLRTDDEIRRFLAAAKKRDDEAKELSVKAQVRTAPVYALYATAVYSGLRLGELCGLRWCDLDFAERLITVARSYDHPTKSGDVRFVPLVDALAPILAAWKLETGGEENAKDKKQNFERLVFPTVTGEMRGPMDWVFQETFHAVLADANLSRLRFHDLRHTFASHWVLKGGDLFRLQKALGHHSQAMVQRYSHLSPGAFESIRGIFGAAPPSTEPGEIVDAADAREKHRRKKGRR